MPGPDLDGLDVEEGEEGSFIVIAAIMPDGNRRNRLARARRIVRNISTGGWRCRECGGPVPLYKRTDALYCRAACRWLNAHDPIGLSMENSLFSRSAGLDLHPPTESQR